MSSRGAINEYSERRYVPFILSFYVVFIVCDSLLLAFKLYCRFIVSKNLSGSLLSIQALTSFRSTCFFLPLLYVLLHFRREARTKLEDREFSEFKTFIGMSERFASAENKIILKNLAAEQPSALSQAFKEIFSDEGYALSDVCAGFFVLRSIQKNHQPNLRCFTTLSSSPLAIREFHTFSPYFVAAYGLVLLPPAKAFKILLSRTVKRILNQKSGKNSALYIESVSAHLGCKNDQILDFSSGGGIYEPAFYALYAEQSSEVVIVIRGTLSISDCITDLICHPSNVGLQYSDFEADDLLAHHGILQSALRLIERFEKNGLIERMRNDQALRDKPVVIVGHSLGAGVAVLLSILLHDMSGLSSRVRCLAYSPPGGLLSLPLSKISSSYVKAIYVGDDVVPRLSRESVRDLRENIIKAIHQCVRKKLTVFFHWNAHSSFFVKADSFKESTSPCEGKLHPPQNIIALKRCETQECGSFSWSLLSTIPWLTYVVLRALCRLALWPLIALFNKLNFFANKAVLPQGFACESQVRSAFFAEQVNVEDYDELGRIKIGMPMFLDHLPGAVSRAIEATVHTL